MLTQGGDGLTMLEGSRVVQQEGLPCDSEMLIKYFTETLNGVISAEQYGNPDGDGRIQLVHSHTHSFSEDDNCVCGERKADYSGYHEAYARYQEIIRNNNLNDAAIEYAREEFAEMANTHLGGMWLKNNYTEDEQYILDGLEEDINEMCDVLEEGIADGTFLKPDYTEIEERIAEFEKTHPEEEYKELIAEMKADLEEIKASNPESMAEIADDIEAIEAKISDAINCDHICHSDNFFLNMIWRIVNFFCSIFEISPICECGELHYTK